MKRRDVFRLTPIAAAFIAITQASAQQAPPPGAPAPQKGEKIEVTGFRSSVDAALQEKREDKGIVDVIKAEDIAKFPDTNLAEALQRVSGVVIDRDAGEGRTITVRGLGPEFTRVRINGIEALATTGGTDSSGGNNRSRGFDFNVFASELFSSIVVRKSASADVDDNDPQESRRKAGSDQRRRSLRPRTPRTARRSPRIAVGDSPHHEDRGLQERSVARDLRTTGKPARDRPRIPLGDGTFRRCSLPARRRYRLSSRSR